MEGVLLHIWNTLNLRQDLMKILELSERIDPYVEGVLLQIWSILSLRQDSVKILEYF